VARLRPVKTNFTNGEVDPLIIMRSDLELFVNGAAKMRNVLPFPQGGFRRRDGLETMTLIPPLDAPVTTIPLALTDIVILSGGTGYSVEDILTVVGGSSTVPARIRVASVNAGVILTLEMVRTGDYTTVPNQGAATAGGGANNATVNFNVETQDVVKLIDFNFSISQNYIIAFTVSRFYVFRKEDTGSGPNQLVATVDTNVYDNQQLNEITWTQSLDVMIIFHNEPPMRKVIRQSENNWSFDEFFPANSPSFAFGLIQTGTLTVPIGANAIVGGSITITATGAPFTVADDVGKHIRIIAATDSDGINFSSYYVITAVGGTGSVTATILVLPIVTSSVTTFDVGGDNWLLEEDEFSPEHGYPRCGQFFQGRLVTASTTDRPQTIFTSRAGDINDFNSGTTADDLGIVVTADSGTQTILQNIHAGRHLQFFGDNSEYYIPISEFDPITPNNVALRRTSTIGSIGGIPVFDVDGVVYFTQRGGESFREFSFVDGVKAYEANVVSLFSSHLIRNPSDAAFKKSLNTEEGNYIWVVNSEDFSLAVFGVLKSELINAWSLQTTQGKFKGVAVSDQDTYFHVTRTPGGTIDYSGNFRDLSVSQGAGSDPQGVAMSNDGTKMFVVSEVTDKVYEYALNTPFSLERVVYTGNEFNLSGETLEPKDVVISPDGTKMFIIARDTDLILEYDMEDPNSLFLGNVTNSGFTLDLSGVADDPTGFDFSADGTKVIVVDAVDNKVYLFTANTAFTFEDGTAFTGDEFDIVGESGNAQDVKWSADGLRFFIIDGATDNIIQYAMTTAFDITTASFTGELFGTANEDNLPRGMTFSSDGLTLFTAGTQTDTIYEYDLSNPYQFGTETDWIEFFQKDLKFDAAVVQFNGITTPITEITGQTQLANETVGIIIDDVVHENQVVDANGDLIFPIEAHYNFQVGLPFPNIILQDENNVDFDSGFNVLVQTLPADVLLSEGTTMGKKKRIPSCTVRFFETQGFYLQGILVPFRFLPQVLDRPIPLQTGEKELRGLLGWDNFGQITIAQREPLAMTVLGLGYDLSTGT